MPAYALEIGERSFWIDAHSDTGALDLTASSLCDEMSEDEKVLLVTDLGARVLLETTVGQMRTRRQRKTARVDGPS